MKTKKAPTLSGVPDRKTCGPLAVCPGGTLDRRLGAFGKTWFWDTDIPGALVVGSVSGGAGALYRVLFQTAEEGARRWAVLAGSSWATWSAVGGLVLLGAWILGEVLRRLPALRGSGVPQTEADLRGMVSLPKGCGVAGRFVTGPWATVLGFSLGRHGPSVQIGAWAAQWTQEVLGGKIPLRGAWGSAGAGAAVAASFAAPLGGIALALEGPGRDRSFRGIVRGTVAPIVGGLLGVLLFGSPTVTLPAGALPRSFLPGALLLGVLVGAEGRLFSRMLLGVSALSVPLGTRFPRGKMLLPAAAGLVLGPLVPEALGGGQPLVESWGALAPTATDALMLLAAKAFLSALAFASGASGGTFLPFLTLGALSGVLAGGGSATAVLGMGAFLAGGLGKPWSTGILLLEITGRWSLAPFLALSLVGATLGARMAGGDPLFEASVRHCRSTPEEREHPAERSV